MNSSYSLTVPEVAKMFKRNEATIRAWARTNQLPAVKIGRDWFFLESAIRERLTPTKTN